MKMAQIWFTQGRGERVLGGDMGQVVFFNLREGQKEKMSMGVCGKDNSLRGGGSFLGLVRNYIQ